MEDSPSDTFAPDNQATSFADPPLSLEPLAAGELIDHDDNQTQDQQNPQNDASETGMGTAAATQDPRGGQNAAMPEDQPSPQSYSELMDLCYAYHDAYRAEDPGPLENHLERAKEVAVKLLGHYFPADEAFVIELTHFLPMTKYGWTIPSNPRKQDARIHHIPAELITGFVVKRRYQVENEDGSIGEELVPQTILAIVIDDLKTYDDWDHTKSCLVNRWDIFNLALDRLGIKKGTAIMILGPAIEFYSYDLDRKVGQSTEKLFHSCSASHSFRFCDPDMYYINMVFTAVAARPITHKDGFVAEGFVAEGADLNF